MLSLNQIQKFYPANLHRFGQFLFKEYLQYRILETVFTSRLSSKLSFLGWTNLRIVHENSRFSEDLDFDNFGISPEEFEILSEQIREALISEGFETEIKTVYKGAFRCYVKIPKILKDLGFAEMEEEKILIQIDTVPHGFEYEPDTVVLSKFWTVFKIRSTPPDILLSQKIWAAFNRPRKKGRDFFDIVFLFAFVRPNFAYLREKMGISNFSELKVALLHLCDSLDFDDLAEDVRPFLFDDVRGANSVRLFHHFVETLPEA